MRPRAATHGRSSGRSSLQRPRKQGGHQWPASRGDIHHLRLTVTDVERSRDCSTGLLGFDVAVESPPSDDPVADAMYEVLRSGVGPQAPMRRKRRIPRAFGQLETSPSPA
jgi:hypothetical protein